MSRPPFLYLGLVLVIRYLFGILFPSNSKDSQDDQQENSFFAKNILGTPSWGFWFQLSSRYIHPPTYIQKGIYSLADDKREGGGRWTVGRWRDNQPAVDHRVAWSSRKRGRRGRRRRRRESRSRRETKNRTLLQISVKPFELLTFKLALIQLPVK